MKMQKIIEGNFKDFYRIFTDKNEFVATGLTKDEANYFIKKVLNDDKMFDPKPRFSKYGWSDYYDNSYYGSTYGYNPTTGRSIPKTADKKVSHWWNEEPEPVFDVSDKTANDPITADEINIENHSDIIPPEEQKEWLKYYGLSEDDDTEDEEFVDTQHGYLTDEQAEVAKVLDEIDTFVDKTDELDESIENNINQEVGEFEELEDTEDNIFNDDYTKNHVMDYIDEGLFDSTVL